MRKQSSEDVGLCLLTRHRGPLLGINLRGRPYLFVGDRPTGGIPEFICECGYPRRCPRKLDLIVTVGGEIIDLGWSAGRRNIGGLFHAPIAGHEPAIYGTHAPIIGRPRTQCHLDTSVSCRYFWTHVIAQKRRPITPAYHR